MLKLDAKQIKQVALLGLVTTELLAYIGGGIFLGYELDSYLQSEPIALSIFAVLGLVIATIRIRKLIFSRKKSNGSSL